MGIIGIHHVQLAMPEGGEDEAGGFYEKLLGIPAPKPAHLATRGGCWFEVGEVRIHLGVEAGFVPARKPHPALLVNDLATLVARLEDAGVEVVRDELLAGFDRIYLSDPFGNRLEFLEPRAG